MKRVLFLFLILFSTTILAKEDFVIESQPEILFQYKKLQKGQETLELQVAFNKAVSHLNKEEFEKAIPLFEKTTKILKIPSYLNLGISYYKLGQIEDAKRYLNEIFDLKLDIQSNVYSYMSACYYLYKITENYNYIDRIIEVSKKNKNLSEHAKRLLADAYILLGEYHEALKVIDTLNFSLDLKKAILYLKIRDYHSATVYLEKALETTVNQEVYNKILWLLVYKDLKTNKLDLLLEHIQMIDKRRDSFQTNLQMPLKIYFNPKKFSTQEYLEQITKFDLNRKIDYIFYFAPFIFSDNSEVFYDTYKGFIFGQKQNIESLEKMVEYNAHFLNIIKDDPINKVYKLQQSLGIDTKSYVYYNLALSYAHIFDFNNAYKYFNRAYKLNPGNKLFAVMTLLSAQRINLNIPDKDYIESNLKKDGGLFSAFGLEIYKLLINPEMKIKLPEASAKYKRTIFYKGIKFIENIDTKGINKNDPLIMDYPKDPLVYLMNLIIREKGVSDFKYFANIQDNLPLTLNDSFLSGPLVVTNYYVDLLKAMGLFKNANFELTDNSSPSYLRAVALRELHFHKPDTTIKILDYLQEVYKLEDKYTLYMQVAALLEGGRYNDASVQISLIKALLNDEGADFLTGVQLIQDLKLRSVSQYFRSPYYDSLIDFQLLGLDEFLQSL